MRRPLNRVFEIDLAHGPNAGGALAIDLIDRRAMPPLGAVEAARRPARMPPAIEAFDARRVRLSALLFTGERAKAASL